MKNIKYYKGLLLVLFFAAGLSSCEKDDPFIETNVGKQTLGFNVNGEKLTYAVVGSILDGTGVPPCNDVKGKVENDTLYISAGINDQCFNSITFGIPISKVAPGKSLKLENKDFIVSLCYSYYLTNISEEDKKFGVVAYGRSTVAEFESGEFCIRYYNQEDNIVAGSFTLNGHVEIPEYAAKEVFENNQPHYQSLPKGKMELNITNGMYDVKIGDQSSK